MGVFLMQWKGGADDRRTDRLYYTDEWAEIAPQGIYPLLCKCLQEARSCIPPTLWELLHKSWFHDTYVLELTCTQSKGKHVVRLTIEKDAAELSKVVLEFPDVSLFQARGNIVDAKACFPLPPNGTPIGQIMDISRTLSMVMVCPREGLALYQFASLVQSASSGRPKITG